MARRSLTYDDLYRLREASDPRLAPDGKTVAFVVTTADRESDENHRSIWSVSTMGGEPQQLTRGKADFLPRWAPDGRHLAFIRKDDDAPQQVWVLPAAGGEARKLTDLILGAAGAVWSPDSSRVAVLATVDIDGEERAESTPLVVRSAVYKADGTGLIGSKRTQLFVVDAETGQSEQLTKGDLTVVTPAWSPDGTRIAFAGTTEDRDVTPRTKLFVMDAGGGEPDEIARWEGSARAPLFTSDGATIVFVGQVAPGPRHSRLWSIPVDGGKPELLTGDFDLNVMTGAPAYPGALPSLLADGAIVFCARDRGCTNVFMLSGGKVTKVAGDGERVVSAVTTAAGSMSYLVNSQDIPADVFAASIDGSNERRLTDLNRELLDEVELHTPESRIFTAPDGTEIQGWVMRGDGQEMEPQPLLVDIHGGPHNAWNPGFDSAHIYQEVLASQGWSILRLNPRGSDGYGESFYTAVLNGWGIADEHDFLSSIDALVEEGLADRDRVAVCGYSYGGHMSNWLTARFPDRFAAAVSGGCLSDYTSYYGSADIGYSLGSHELGAEPFEDPDLYRKLSPITYVKDVKTPTLMLHGENDDRCPIGQAEQWFVSLRRRGVEVEMVRYPGASHLFIVAGRPSHRTDYNRRVADWVTEHDAR